MSEPREIAEAVGAEVRKIRLAKGWSLAKLAEEADVSSTFLGSVERGAKVPTVTTLVRISRALGVPSGLILAPLDQVDKMGRREFLELVPSFCRDGYTAAEVTAILAFIKDPPAR